MNFCNGSEKYSISMGTHPKNITQSVEGEIRNSKKSIKFKRKEKRKIKQRSFKEATVKPLFSYPKGQEYVILF